MVSPDRYNMASDMSHPVVGTDGLCFLGMSIADRLEAAIDNALLDAAACDHREGCRNRLMNPGDYVALQMSTGWDIGRWVWEKTKIGIAKLFDRTVKQRYADAGWSDIFVRYDYPQSQAMTFLLGIDKPAKRLFVSGLELETTHVDGEPGLRVGSLNIHGQEVVRMLSWLARAKVSHGEIDGIDEVELRREILSLVCALDADNIMSSKPGWLRATLDDLRVSAKLKMFDIDMTKQDDLLSDGLNN